MKNIFFMSFVLLTGHLSYAGVCKTDMRCTNGSINIAGDLAGRTFNTVQACGARVQQLKNLCAAAAPFSATYRFNGRAVTIDLNETDEATWVAPVAPSAPTAPTVVAGNASALVKWTPSTGVVYDYEVRAFLGTSTTAAITKQQVTHTSAGFVFTGLTNGSAYRFAVRARNANVYSALSDYSASVTPVSTAAPLAPSIPINLAATAGPAEVELNWSPSVGVVTDYEIRAYIGTATTAAATRTGVAYSNQGYSFTGLVTGTAYTFKIRARNGTAYSGFSMASNSASPKAYLNCTFNGKTVLHGQKVVAYQYPSSDTCAPQDRICTNGVLSGTWTYPSCIIECSGCGA